MFSAPRETSVMFLKEIYYFNLSNRSLKCIKYSSSLIALDSLPYWQIIPYSVHIWQDKLPKTLGPEKVLSLETYCLIFLGWCI